MSIRTANIPLVDVGAWRQGDSTSRRQLVQAVDGTLRRSGFLMVEGHGVSAWLADAIRRSARSFFALPAEAKERYRVPVGGRGWLRMGGEANAFYGEVADPARADLKESLTIGRTYSTGDPATDAEWFTPNVWPAEQPELEGLCESYVQEVRRLYADLLRICAAALELPEDWFLDRSRLSPHTFNINRYPPFRATGPALPGQYRVAPHTDWGVLTVLDRQPGYGGLQVQTLDGDWADAPYVPGALTVNVGDLLARWSGDRWRSTRHRVLPPPEQSPDEDLVSLVVFLECDLDTVIEPLCGSAHYEPVVSRRYLRDRARAATVS